MEDFADLPQPLVLFDGVCPLCSFWVQFAAPRDRSGQIRFAAVQSPTGQRVLTSLGMPTDTYDSFIVIENGRASIKSAAFFALVKHLGSPWSWSRGLWVLPRPILDWLYDRVARNRYRVFGRRQTCLVPKPELIDRFIE